MEAETFLAPVYNSHKDTTPDVCIIGAGFSGICAAVQLQKQLGLKSFTIFDSNEDVGGTWLVNKYPGCACDVQSHLYSLSFEKNPNWSSNYSSQEEIWNYMRKVAEKYNVYPHVKFNTEVKSLEWDDSAQKWKATYVDNSTNNNEEKEMLFDIVINGSGGLREPHIPEQFLTFNGPKIHSAKWDSSIEIDKTKVVAVVGSGASAIQIIPSIADDVKELHVYQRKAAWVMPRTQFEFPKFVQFIFAYVPFVMWMFRCLIYLFNELHVKAFFHNTLFSKLAPKHARYHRNKQLPDSAELVETLTPKYTFGCKRVLVSQDYFPAMAKPQVKVHTSHIDKVTEDSIITKDGNEQKIDILILATGFKVQDYFAPLQIIGKNGINILDLWKKEGPRHYNGIVCSSIPNHFYLLGPNTALGHSSVIFQIECQVDYTMAIIKEIIQRNAKSATLKKSVEDEYMDEIKEGLKKTVWGNTECGSWYANARGENTTLWPKSCTSYWKQTKKIDFEKFEFN